MLIILVGCSKSESSFKIIFDENHSKNHLALIYEYDQNKKIYSEFSNIDIKIDNENISLSEALSQKKIDMNDIINKMELLESDHNISVYRYNKGAFSKKSFILVHCECDKNKNIYIGTQKKLSKKCNLEEN